MGTAKADGLVGQVVEERYRIESTLGRGAMGVVYKARHVKVGREVAIKILHDHLVRDPTMVARFDREAAIAARIDHQNLIKVIDVGETADKQKLMVLELARGENLAAIVAHAPLQRARVVDLVRQLLRGLEHAHGAGLVHRDLKPENVIVELDDHGMEVPRIVDFGLAVLHDQTDDAAARRLTAAGLILGTPAYMAPEQARGAGIDPRTDLFALGVMVYEMLAGRQPFDGTSMEIVMANITDDPPPISIRSGAIADPLLEAFARRLMARELGDRFSSARAALDMLELIERDRDAAMLTFGLLPHAPVAAAEPAPAIPQRDTVATVVFSGSAVRRSARRGEVSAVRKPDSTRRWAIVGGMAVALIAFVIGLAAPRAIVAEAPALELPVAAVEQGMSIRATRTEPPPPAAQVREIPRAPRRIATAAVTPRPRTAAAAAPAPAPAAQSAAEVALIDPGAAEVARRYVAVGQALTRATDVDELWVTYRWIRLNDALATSVGRQAALRAIEHIERDLAGRAP